MKEIEIKTETEPGILKRIFFQKDQFIIGQFFSTESHILFTAKGSIVNPQMGMTYTLKGKWEENPKFGRQFDIQIYETVMPQDETGIFNYIVRICKYVGTSVGNALVNTYGQKTLEIMKHSPDRVAAEIHGITEERAKEISKTLKDNADNERLQVALEALLDVPGMRKNVLQGVVDRYKHKAPDMIKEDPYILTTFKGVGFPLADKVALMRVKLPRESPLRQRAAMVYCLKEHTRQGHVWMFKRKLFQETQLLIQVPDLGEVFKATLDDEILKTTSDGLLVTLFNLAMKEQAIAAFVMEGSHVSEYAAA